MIQYYEKEEKNWLYDFLSSNIVKQTMDVKEKFQLSSLYSKPHKKYIKEKEEKNYFAFRFWKNIKS